MKKNIAVTLTYFTITILVLLFAGLVSGIIYVDIPSKPSIKYFDVDSGYNLTLSSEIKSFVQSHYNTYKEYAICLEGDLYTPYNFQIKQYSKFIEGNNYSVTLDCRNNIGFLHSHPSGKCFASNGDVTAFREQSKNGVTLFIIQCASNKFIVYTQEDLSKGYNYEI